MVPKSIQNKSIQNNKMDWKNHFKRVSRPSADFGSEFNIGDDGDVPAGTNYSPTGDNSTPDNGGGLGTDNSDPLTAITNSITSDPNDPNAGSNQVTHVTAAPVIQPALYAQATSNNPPVIVNPPPPVVVTPLLTVKPPVVPTTPSSFFSSIPTWGKYAIAAACLGVLGYAVV